MNSSSLKLKSLEFRRERERTWRELERLVAKVEREGIRSLSAQELSRLPLVYRATVSSLGVARSISLDSNVADYLNGLATRAYFCVYGPKRRLGDALADFALARFPEAVRRIKGCVTLSAIALLLGTLAGNVLTLGDPELFDAFVDPDLAQGRGPSATTEALRAVLYSRDDKVAGLSAFATFLFTHNARIGMLAFAVGFAAGLPTFFLLLVNGLMLGAFGALYQSRGLGAEFWAWVLPHGVTELLAVVLCGAAGFAMAESLVFPGRNGRLQNLATRGRLAGVVVIGSVVLFLIAGLIEGLFRQLVHDVTARYGVALMSAAFWFVYFGWAGRRGDS